MCTSLHLVNSDCFKSYLRTNNLFWIWPKIILIINKSFWNLIFPFTFQFEHTQCVKTYKRPLNVCQISDFASIIMIIIFLQGGFQSSCNTFLISTTPVLIRFWTLAPLWHPLPWNDITAARWQRMIFFVCVSMMGKKGKDTHVITRLHVTGPVQLCSRVEQGGVLKYDSGRRGGARVWSRSSLMECCGKENISWDM